LGRARGGWSHSRIRKRTQFRNVLGHYSFEQWDAVQAEKYLDDLDDATEATNRLEADYAGDGRREALIQDEEFSRAFTEAKVRVRNMDFRYVEETDPTRQALLEIYASVVLETP
jgi:hypothetical protein